MWNFFLHCFQSVMADEGLLDSNVDQVLAFVIAVMSKEPQAFATMQLSAGALGQTATPLEMSMSLGQKVMQLSELKEQELSALPAISLYNALFENLQGISGCIEGVIELYLSELARATTREYKLTLLMGILTSFWYDVTATLTALEAKEMTAAVVNAVLENVSSLDKDYEVKRFTLGMTALISTPDVPDVVKGHYQPLMQALAFLCAKSIEIRAKALLAPAKGEMADVEEEGDVDICEDEDDIAVEIESDDDCSDEWDGDDDDDNAILYDCPLDAIDEVLHLSQLMAQMTE